MAKQQINVRLSDEADAACGRLCDVWGCESRSSAIEDAVQCWEWALVHVADSVAKQFTRQEWSVLADSMQGSDWPYGRSGSGPGALLAAETHDAHRLSGLGYRWLCGMSMPPSDLRDLADAQVRGLCGRLAALGYVEAWAVIRALCWFWQHDDVDCGTDEWWRVDFRRSHDRDPKVSGGE